MRRADTDMMDMTRASPPRNTETKTRARIFGSISLPPSPRLFIIPRAHPHRLIAINPTHICNSRYVNLIFFIPHEPHMAHMTHIHSIPR